LNIHFEMIQKSVSSNKNIESKSKI